MILPILSKILDLILIIRKDQNSSDAKYFNYWIDETVKLVSVYKSSINITKSNVLDIF